jgi:Predicted transcriptional regulator
MCLVNEADTDEILALLEDQYARVILQQTRNNALSAKEISEICDISISTVYRRTERLIECGLLAERRVAQPDGNHYSLYEARLDEVTVRLTNDGFEITISEKETSDLADRFTDMWERL